jgi:hypothetical protein
MAIADIDTVGLTVVELSTGTWSGDAPARAVGANPIMFLGATDPQDGANGITTPANINNWDRWVDTSGGSPTWKIRLSGAWVEITGAGGGAPVFAESFNKADGALGPDQTWFAAGGTTSNIVVSNVLRQDVAGAGYDVVDSGSIGPDGYAQLNATAIATTGGPNGVRLLGRFSRSVVTNGYLGGIEWDSTNGWRARILKFVAGVSTALVQQAISAPSLPAVIRFEVQDALLVLKVAGKPVAALIDSSIETGNYYGVSMRAGVSTANAVADAFEAGTL